jgi:hypothetical protein
MQPIEAEELMLDDHESEDHFPNKKLGSLVQFPDPNMF